jgi:enoyl-CoA hydratase/carnithine racemase
VQAQQQEEEAVRVERDGHVAVVTLNRPDAINAISQAMRRQLPAALQALEADDDVRAVVLTGSGPRGFCAGADIKEFAAAETSLQARRRLLQGGIQDAIERFSKPVVAAIHGFCLGGGLEIALACDIRIAAAGAQFGLPETGLGLIPGGGGTQRLPRIVGLGRALDLLLTGDRIDAAEAHRIGLVTRVVPEVADLLEEAMQVARRIAAKPPAASAAAKEAARVGSTLDLQAGLRLEKDLFALLLATEDKLEAAAAFREKRAPRFTGR